MKPRFALLPAILVFATISATAAQPDHWVGTWGTAVYGGSNPDSLYTGVDTTIREIVHVSLGGSRIRVTLSNEFGTAPLTIGAAHVALSAGGPDIALASANALTFSGQPSIVIPANSIAVSDPVDLKLPGMSDLAVSLFIPAQTVRALSYHNFADQTNYSVTGNVVSEKSLTSPTKFYAWHFLKSVDVLAGANDGAIAAFGDSITDGALSTRDANLRWPDVLARRLQADKKLSGLGVLNEGIGGNRVLHDGTGPSALARFDRDVIAQEGVKYVILMESINDIGVGTGPKNPHDTVSAQDLIAGLQQLVERAHIHNIKAIGATLTPFVGAGYQSPEGETIRTTVNDWIRSNKSLDGVIDFDMVTRDPSNPSVMAKFADSGDHLHPGDAGYKAMGESIDLKLFGGK